MKNKAVISLCKSYGRMDIYNTDNCMWVGNGSALYAMRGVPQMEASELCATFDIPEKKQMDMVFRTYNEGETALDFKDVSASEIELEEPIIRLTMDGTTIIGYETDDGILWMNGAYLVPLSGKELEYSRFFVRYISQTARVFAVKAGLQLAAIIVPYVMPKEIQERLYRAAQLMELESTNERDSGKHTS